MNYEYMFILIILSITVYESSFPEYMQAASSISSLIILIIAVALLVMELCKLKETIVCQMFQIKEQMQ